MRLAERLEFAVFVLILLRWLLRQPQEIATDGTMLGLNDFGRLLEAAGGFEPPYNGFADRRLTAWLSRH